MPPLTSVIDAIGHTPLIKLQRASEETDCTILGKAEFLNPGQSVKDRAALGIIRDAEKKGQLSPGGTIVEGTAGNTGIGISMVGRALGYNVEIVMPCTQSEEKKQAVRMLGAKLVEVDAVPYTNPKNYVHYSQKLAQERGAFWANQFDNVANRTAHEQTTACEIWEQTDGKVDGFICAIGSGGTIGGMSLGLKQRNQDVTIALADPGGSKMYSWVKTGELEAEGGSITEGIGQGRITANLEGIKIDDAYRIHDQRAADILFRLIREEGLCLGGSSGINIAGAIELAKTMGPGKTIVTMLCDYGNRYASTFYNHDYLLAKGLTPPDWYR
ncbi:MAG: cysteine synthase A [bacterium]